ncbi:unnamed protein product [Closterium sp. NIES-53]
MSWPCRSAPTQIVLVVLSMSFNVIDSHPTRTATPYVPLSPSRLFPSPRRQITLRSPPCCSLCSVLLLIFPCGHPGHCHLDVPLLLHGVLTREAP